MKYLILLTLISCTVSPKYEGKRFHVINNNIHFICTELARASTVVELSNCSYDDGFASYRNINLINPTNIIVEN